MKTHVISLCSIVLLIIISSAVGASTTAPAVESSLQRAAVPLAEFAVWCSQNKARSAGELAIQSAKIIVENPERIDQVTAALESAGDDGASSPEVEKGRQTAIDSAVGILQELASDAKDWKDEALRDYYLQKAYRISEKVAATEALARALAADRPEAAADWYALLAVRDPKQAEAMTPKLLEKKMLPEASVKAVREFLAQERPLSAIGFLTELSKVDPKGFTAGKYQPSVDLLAAKPLLVRIPAHPIAAYVAISWKWNPLKTAPVLFCFAGTGREYKGICDSYQTAVGDGPFVVVSPVTLSNTNVVSEDAFKSWYAKDIVRPYISPSLTPHSISQRLQFDQPGIRALLKAVSESANTEQKMYIAGFSGGGMPSYAMMISSPELIAAAAPVCANFYLSLPPQGKVTGVRVQQFFGEKDPNNAAIGRGRGLIAQGREAATVLSPMGYEVAEPRMVPSVGHAAMAKHVVEFFNSARADRQRKLK